MDLNANWHTLSGEQLQEKYRSRAKQSKAFLSFTRYPVQVEILNSILIEDSSWVFGEGYPRQEKSIGWWSHGCAKAFAFGLLNRHSTSIKGLKTPNITHLQIYNFSVYSAAMSLSRLSVKYVLKENPSRSQNLEMSKTLIKYLCKA